MQDVQVHVLSRSEVDTLNKDGFKLSNDHLYIQSFLINPQKNNAGDPDPFIVPEKLLNKLGRSSIGKPFLIPPEGKLDHIRGATALEYENAEAIIEYQKAFAAGEIVDYWINPQTKNVNVIIDVFPAYKEKILRGKLPSFVSPLVSGEFSTTTNELLDGEILHLQAVDNPGYPRQIAKINAVCAGGLSECMRELRIKGANSSLFSYQNIHSQLFNTKIHKQGQMPEPETPTIESLKTEIDDLRKEIKGASGLITEIKTGLEAKVETDNTKADTEGGSQGEDFTKLKTDYDELQKKLQTIEDERKKEAEERLAADRTRVATEIVENQMRLHMISPNQKSAKIKSLVEAKKSDGTLEDLTLLHNTLKEQASKIKGAFGGDFVEVAELETETQTDPNYDEIYQRITT